MAPSVTARNISKSYRAYSKDRPGTLQEAVVRGLRGLRAGKKFWALQEVSFDLEPGRMMGVIGANGAGKSTLLRLVGGVGRPDQGSLEVNGRIGALIDLGAGFHPDLTGRENVYINGVISGLTRQEVGRQFEAIVSFAELEAFIDSPLRTYSTGMQMRLAFAIAVHIQPEVLLIDEVLAVGDLAFQRKCLDRIAYFKQQGCAILLVTHDISLVEQLCEQALWLRQGRVAASGPAVAVAQAYITEMRAETQRRTPSEQRVTRTPQGVELRLNENRLGSQEMQIERVSLRPSGGQPGTEIDSGEGLRVEIEYNAPLPIPSPIFGVTVTRADGLVCSDLSTGSAGLALPTLHGQGVIALNFDRLDLAGGDYYVDVGVYHKDWAYAYDYHWRVYPLAVRPSPGEKGVLRSPHRWELGEPVAHS
jgi:lipopolysaccharide transport system ATP-binding protein